MNLLGERKKLISASTILLILLVGCMSSPEASETREATKALYAPTKAGTVTSDSPALTATLEARAIPTSSDNKPSCPPDNFAFPDPEELENYIGWQYVHDRLAFDYPRVHTGELIERGGQEYGFDSYELGDLSFMLALKKILCRDSANNPAWEIIDVVKTRPLRLNERADIGWCKKDGEHTSDYPFVFMDKSNNGKVYMAWIIDGNEKIVEASTEGLWCIVEGVES
ncbi:MAG: hypothetical protein AB1750_02185 [Chloroflexota bacterium]